MTFWNLKHPSNDIAVIEGENRYSYSELQSLVNEWKTNILSEKKRLVFLLCNNTVSSLTIYLASLQEKHAVCLLPSNIETSLLKNLLEIYRPLFVCRPESGETFENYKLSYILRGYELFSLKEGKDIEAALHPDLALMLSTSGTTGSPKMVRLSYTNIQNNAESISEYLELTASERPITTLPMQYSYGLSVINSHLSVGASIVMTEQSVTSKEFWDQVRSQNVTSIAGVPYIYQILHRLRFGDMDFPGLKMLTQAGGRLDHKLQEYFSEVSNHKNLKFFIMYGQTEATARMSYLPPNCLTDKKGSIGIAIPGGEFNIDEDGQLVYRGLNVMMGYAETIEDLALGNLLNGCLETGDLAECDEEGYYYITGRKKRFIKLFGLRINLDDVEKLLEKNMGHAICCVGNDSKMKIFVPKDEMHTEIKELIVKSYHLHPTSFKIETLEELPRLESGKVDYKTLQRLGGLE